MTILRKHFVFKKIKIIKKGYLGHLPKLHFNSKVTLCKLTDKFQILSQVSFKLCQPNNVVKHDNISFQFL